MTDAPPPAEPDPGADPSTAGWAWVAVLALWLGALGGRLTGLDYLLPHAPEPDAYVVGQALIMEAEEGAPDDARGAVVWRKYPHLMARLLTLAGLESAGLPTLTAATLDEHLAAAARPTVLGRALSALLASLAVPLTFLLARRFLAPGPALVAAALVATSLLHLYLSQMARPHAPVTSFTLATTWLAVEWTRRARTWVALGAAVAAGLSIATLHNGLAALTPLGVAWLLTLKRDGARSALTAGAGLGAAALALWLAYPFLGEEPPAMDAATNLDASELETGHVVTLEQFGGGGFAVIGRALVDYDPILAALGAIGLVCALFAWRRADRSRRTAAIVVAGFALPYLAAIGAYDLTFERFALPLWPILAMAAAAAVDGAARLAGGRPTTLLLAAVVALAIPAGLFARKLQLNLRPDTYQLAAEVVNAELDPAGGPLVLSPAAFPPLALTETVDNDEPWVGISLMPWRDHLLSHPPGDAALEIRRAPGRYDLGPGRGRARDGTIAERTLRTMLDQLTATGGRWILHTDLRPGERRGAQEQALERFATKLRDVTPWRDGDVSGAEIGYQGESAVMRLIDSERLGPVLRLWDLR